jgi:hypothetical protein
LPSFNGGCSGNIAEKKGLITGSSNSDHRLLRRTLVRSQFCWAFFVIQGGNPDWFFSMACHPEVRGISGCLINMLVKKLNLPNRITSAEVCTETILKQVQHMVQYKLATKV